MKLGLTGKPRPKGMYKLDLLRVKAEIEHKGRDTLRPKKELK